MRRKKRKNPFININIIKVITSIILLVIVFNIAPNYEKNDSYAEGKINLIINNNNITKELKHDLFVNDKDVIYMSKDDIETYFDEDIIYDEKNNQITTTFGEKIAELPLNENIIRVNGRSLDILSGAIKKDNQYYIPIVEMKKVYELDIEYIEKEQILILDSLSKKLVKADISKSCNVKYKPTSFSKTVDKLERADTVVCIEKLKNNWTKIRTKSGKIGYVKTNILKNEIYVRDDVEK